MLQGRFLGFVPKNFVGDFVNFTCYDFLVNDFHTKKLNFDNFGKKISISTTNPINSTFCAFN